MIKKSVIENYIEQGISFKEAAKKEGVTYNTFLRWAGKYNLKSPIGNHGAKKTSYNYDFFETIDTEEKAYWLGFIAADGCVYYDSGRMRLQINLKGSDKEHLEKFQKAIGSTYKITEKFVKQSPVCQVKINSNKMCEDLSKYNIVPRKSIIYTPVEISEELTHHFIRGFFDGDGWIKDYERKNSNSFRVNVGIVGGDNCLDYFKKHLPEGFSIYKLKNNDNVKSLESSSREVLKATYDYLYKDATVFLNRKKERFDNILSRLTEM